MHKKKNFDFIYDEESIMSSLLAGVKWSNNRFTSPFRLDKKPDCKLFKAFDGRVMLYDPVLGQALNCFQVYAKLNNVSIAQSFYDLKTDFTFNL